MLDTKDIVKLKSLLATKQDLKNLATKKDLKEVKIEVSKIKSDMDSKFTVIHSDIQDIKKDVESLREAIQAMMVSIDGLAKVISDLRLEYAVISTQLTRHERWIKQIAEKVGLDLAME